VGRFVSTDPLQADPAVSSYAYAGNDPTTFVDPSGLGAVWGNPCTSFRCLLKGVLKLAGWHSGCERSRLCLGLFAANVIPFVGGDLIAGRIAGRIAVEGAERAVAIGRNMPGRVIPYAQAHGYDWYRGTPRLIPFRNKRVDMWFNRRWVRKEMRGGSRVVDIGEPLGMPPSDFYNMERAETEGYWNLVLDLQP
jgi:hypothetical protein